MAYSQEMLSIAAIPKRFNEGLMLYLIADETGFRVTMMNISSSDIGFSTRDATGLRSMKTVMPFHSMDGSTIGTNYAQNFVLVGR